MTDCEARQHGAVSEAEEHSLHDLYHHLAPVVTAQPSQPRRLDSAEPEQETQHSTTKALHPPAGGRPAEGEHNASAWKREFGNWKMLTWDSPTLM